VGVGQCAQLRNLFPQKKINTLTFVFREGGQIRLNLGIVGGGEHGIHRHAQGNERNQRKAQGGYGDFCPETFETKS